MVGSGVEASTAALGSRCLLALARVATKAAVVPKSLPSSSLSSLSLSLSCGRSSCLSLLLLLAVVAAAAAVMFLVLVVAGGWWVVGVVGGGWWLLLWWWRWGGGGGVVAVRAAVRLMTS